MGRTYHNINKLNLCGQEISQHLATRKKRKNNQVNLHFYLNQNYHKISPILNKLKKHRFMYVMSCTAQIHTVYSILFKLVLFHLTVFFFWLIWDIFWICLGFLYYVYAQCLCCVLFCNTIVLMCLFSLLLNTSPEISKLIKSY